MKKVTSKTVLQLFADFLSRDAGDRDTIYETFVSDTVIMIVRKNGLTISDLNNHD